MKGIAAGPGKGVQYQMICKSFDEQKQMATFFASFGPSQYVYVITLDTEKKV
eukprot:SAG31_NODE_13717_length_851_cov_1.857713_1_plen_52_part_00